MEIKLQPTRDELLAFNKVSSMFQLDVFETTNFDSEDAQKLTDFSKLPEHVQFKDVTGALRHIVHILPFAEVAGINLLSSLIAMHGSITGNTSVTDELVLLQQESIKKKLNIGDINFDELNETD